MEAKSRGSWSSNLGFILAAAGSAVGLGNLWKFPYLTGKYGGAAFVIIYLIAIVVVGFSIMLGEMAIGRSAQLNAIGAYRKLGGPKWSWIGGMGVLAGFLILSYYSVVGGWVLNYIYSFVTGGVEKDTAAYFSSFISNPYQPIFWHFIFMGLSVVVVIRGVAGGIEKCNKIMMPGLFLLLLVVMVRAVTLPGAEAGIQYYLKPDFSKITGESIIAALGQVFFSLSLGMGCIITYGSYLAKKANLQKNAIIVPCLDTGASLLAGLAILPAVFAFGFQPSAGPGLMFITLPQVFQQMPLGGLFGVLFFLLVSFAAITSSISLLEVIAAYFIDELHWSRPKAVILLAVAMFLLGIPCSLSFGPMKDTLILGKNFFDCLDYLSSNILLPLGGLLMCIFICYIWTVEKAAVEISNEGTLRFPMKMVWKIMLFTLTPAAVLVVFLNMIGVI